jgi:hypothetical protein
MGYISTDTLKEILRELDNKLTGTFHKYLFLKRLKGQSAGEC